MSNSEEGASGFLTPEQFEKRWNSIVEYFKRKPFRATIYSLLALALLGASPIGWLRERGTSNELREDIRNLKREHSEKLQKLEREHSEKMQALEREKSSLQTRYDNLETTVAPIIRQAAKDFPGEGINESLKKVVARLEARPSYSLFLDNVRLGPVNVLQVPRAASSKLFFDVENVGTAESRDPQLQLTMPLYATNFLSGWRIIETILVHTNRIEPQPGYTMFSDTMRGRVSVGSVARFKELTLQPDLTMLALGVIVKVEGDGVDRMYSRLWITFAPAGQTNSIVLTGQDAKNALNRIAPRILMTDAEIAKSVWREAATLPSPPLSGP